MKKIIFVFTFFLCFSQMSIAQQKSIGITGGFGPSWLLYKHNNLFSPGFNGGFTFIYSMRKHWGYGFDVKYSREGNKVHQDPTDRNIKTNMDCIRVPLRVTYFLNNYEAVIRPKISLAPTFGFVLDEKRVTRTGDGDRLFSTNRTGRINVLDVGMTAAVGVNFRLSEKVWFATELAYYNGFLDVNKYSRGYTANRNVSLNVGLTMGIGKVK